VVLVVVFSLIGAYGVRVNDYKPHRERAAEERRFAAVHGGVTLTSSANPSVYGQPITFSVSVAVVSPAVGTPTGSVTLTEGSTTVGTITLTSGSGSFTTATLSVGSHSVTATYSGDTNFKGAVSAVLPQDVNQASTTTKVVSSVSPSVFGQSVVFSATVSVVSPGAGSPTGTVTFQDGSTSLGPSSLSSTGTASFSISSLSVNPSHAITAVYSGDTNFVTSTGSVTQVVSQGSTTVTLTDTLGGSPAPAPAPAPPTTGGNWTGPHQLAGLNPAMTGVNGGNWNNKVNFINGDSLDDCAQQCRNIACGSAIWRPSTQSEGPAGCALFATGSQCPDQTNYQGAGCLYWGSAFYFQYP